MRTARESEHELERKASSLRTTLNDLRSEQTFGADNFATYYLPYKGSDDVICDVSASSPICIEVTLTPDSSISNPAIVLESQAQVVIYPGYSGTGAISTEITALPAIGGVQKFHAWAHSTGTDREHVGFRFAFQTIAQATWTAVRIV